MGEAKRRKIAAAKGNPANVATLSDGWPLTNEQAFNEVSAFLQSRGIDGSRPGFHDSAAFLLAERSNPAVIDTVARIVEARPYSEAALKDAEVAIRVAAEAVRAAVEADGRPGRCVIASSVLSRFLDELGIWNYCAKATLTVTFPPDVSRSSRHFYAFDQGQFEAPHAVVVAPPFTIIDLTARHQAYDTRGMAEALPSAVMSKAFDPYQWTVSDIVAPAYPELRAGGRTGLERFMKARKPQMLRMMNALPGRQVTYEGGVLRYVITGVGGYAERLADLTAGANINDRSPLSIYSEDVLPRLTEWPALTERER